MAGVVVRLPWKGGAAVVVVAIAFALLSYFMREVDRIHAADQSLRSLSEATLESRRREKDFLARFEGEGGPTSYARDAYYQRHQEALARARQELTELRGLLPATRQDDLNSLAASVDDYERAFQALARAQAERGSVQHGLFARWLTTGNAIGLLPSSSPVPGAPSVWGEFASAQQRYAVRASAARADALDAVLSKIGGQSSQPLLGASAAARDNLVAHRRAWTRLRTLDATIGWTHADGLRGQMRAAVHRVQPQVGSLVKVISEADERATGALMWAALVVAGGLGGALWFALALASRNRSAARALRVQNSALEAARAEAERANSVKSEFLAVMSHELRTPLNAVMGSASVLRRAPEMLPTLLPAIAQAAEQQLALVNGVLELTGVSGDGPREPVAFVPADVVRDVLALQQESAERKGLAVHVVADERAKTWVSGDEEAVRRILASLVNNAIKFTLEGSVRVVVTGEPPGDDADHLGVTFSVIDSGVGIPDTVRDRIYEPFAQAESATTRRFDGAGIGLSVCKILADRMGAELELESRVKQGTEVRLRCHFPVADSPVMDLVDEAFRGAPRMSLLPQVRVLVVDDGAANRLLLTSLLKTMNVNAEMAVDGQAAVEAHEQRAFDLILMDYHMPSMDGLEATRRIRQMKGRQPRIIGCTADVRSGTEARCREAGMDGFLTKPIKAEQLEAEFAEILAMPA